MSLITSLPVSNFLQSANVLGMQNIGEIAPVAELTNTDYNVHQNLTILADSSGAEIYDLTIVTGNQFANSSKTFLSLGNTVTNIEYSAFSGCSNLSGGLVIPNEILEIGSSAFYSCYGFNNLVLGNSLSVINDLAFAACNGFTGSLILPDSIVGIGNDAFNNCNGFVGSLTIPSSIVNIGSNAFYNSSLVRVYSEVGASVVQDSAFSNSAITGIFYKSGLAGWTNPWNGIATAEWTSWPDPMP